MNCYYCQKPLTTYLNYNYIMACRSCPSHITHYYNIKDNIEDNDLLCVQFKAGKCTLTFYLKPKIYGHQHKYIIFGQGIAQFTEDLHITPYNAEEKIKLLLTFQ